VDLDSTPHKKKAIHLTSVVIPDIWDVSHMEDHEAGTSKRT
jgi:hypothetical protein